MGRTRSTDGAGRYRLRRRRAFREAAAAKVDALLVSRVEDVGYLTGFTGDDSYLLVGERWAVLLTDGRYDEQARRECGDVEIHARTRGMAGTVADALKGRRVRRLAIQGDHFTLAFRDALQEALGSKRIKPLSGLVSPLRMIKDDAEVKAVAKAIGVAQRAFRGLLAAGPRAWVGRSERELAADLDHRMRLAGASGPAFETIVAAGAHGSLPHYRPGSTRVRPGQAVLVDWGAKVAGYCSDLTRVVFTGRIPPKLMEMHEVVRRAQAAAIAVARPGVACKAVDLAARQVIAEAGYGARFVHGLGHGLGRAVHEAPGLGQQSADRLRKGMIVTVEPGIYVPGFGGIRIEDDIYITAGGCRRLTSLPRTIDAMTL